MAFYLDKLADMVRRARNSFRAEMPGTDAWIWPNNVTVSAKVMGGTVWEVFGRLAWMDLQRFAMTATGDELERHGTEYGINRKSAAKAYGKLLVYADYPYTVDAGTQFTRSSDDLTYTATSSADVGKYTGYAIVPVTCDTAGKDGNTLSGAAFTTADSDVTSVTTDDVGLGQGADLEDDESLRERILHRKRHPPAGGSKYDYWFWARELPGVTRAFVAPNIYGPGTVGVYFLMDDTYTAGIPATADVAAMQAYLDVKKPVTAKVYAMAPTPDCIEIEITGLYPNTAAVQESAALEIAAMFRHMSTVGLPDEPFTLRRSWIWNAVSNAAGESYHEVTAPLADLTYVTGVIPCLKSVTFKDS